MDNKARGQILDTVLLKRLMTYTRPYRGVFVFVMFAAILLSVFSTLTPYLLKITVDDYISLKDYDGLVLMISLMLGALFFVFFNHNNLDYSFLFGLVILLVISILLAVNLKWIPYLNFKEKWNKI